MLREQRLIDLAFNGTANNGMHPTADTLLVKFQ